MYGGYTATLCSNMLRYGDISALLLLSRKSQLKAEQPIPIGTRKRVAIGAMELVIVWVEKRVIGVPEVVVEIDAHTFDTARR